MTQLGAMSDTNASRTLAEANITLPAGIALALDEASTRLCVPVESLIEAAARAYLQRRFGAALADNAPEEAAASPELQANPSFGMVATRSARTLAERVHAASELAFEADDGSSASPTPLRLHIELHRLPSPSLQATLAGQPGTAASPDLTWILEGIAALLDGALRSPSAPIGSLPLLGATETACLARWNATSFDHDLSITADALLWSQAAHWGDRVAVKAGALSVDYATLLARADAVAASLRARGVGPGRTVGIYVERDIAMIVAMLGVMRSGAAYVPLDPTYPVSRILTMIADAGLSLIVTQRGLADVTAWMPEDALRIGADGTIGDGARARAAAPQGAPHGPASPAYLIYTSGSTGRPKGVLVPHRAVVNLLGAMRRRFPLEPGDTVLTVTTLSFDIAVLEILLPLLLGATLVVATRADAADGQALRGLIERHDVTLMQATPATWRLLQDEGWPGSPKMRGLVGGEPLPRDLAAWMRRTLKEAWNMYGPTETTVWSTCWRVDGRPRGISIGEPIDNTRVHVLDPDGRPCPVGTPGELCIGGAGVALGYHHRPELTADRFVPDPDSTAPDARLYRTGDLGRWADDGQLEHLGRLDAQIKIRGYRIEPGEIEAALAVHPAVRRCSVTAQPADDGAPELVAYVVPQARSTWDETALREHLRDLVPHYMLPRHIVRLDELPLTPNGKVDRKALPRVDHRGTSGKASTEATLSELEQAVALLWRGTLGAATVSVSDNFFDLGGNSLSAARVLPEMERLVGTPIEPRRLIFENLRQLCSAPAAREEAPGRAAPRALETWLAALSGKAPGEGRRTR